jgi:hypothetical protein
MGRWPMGYPLGYTASIHGILYVGKIQIRWIEKPNEVVMIARHDKEQQNPTPMKTW